MKLQVEQAKEQIGKSFPFRNTMPALSLGDVAAFPWSRHDITISGEYWYDGQHFIMKGIIEREGNYECARCLTSVDMTDSVSFEEAFAVYQSEIAEEMHELPLCDGIQIDVTDLIRETLIINEPYQVLCQEDCKGLCVHCGKNLNDSHCSCDSFVVDPRLAALRTLVIKDDD